MKVKFFHHTNIEGKSSSSISSRASQSIDTHQTLHQLGPQTCTHTAFTEFFLKLVFELSTAGDRTLITADSGALFFLLTASYVSHEGWESLRNL